LRWWDRSCKRKLKNEDGTVNTKKLLQEELNQLYTGDQLVSHYIYSQKYMYLWSVLMYSTGLPILNIFAFFFYLIFFFVYKYLLIKYYQKTSSFDQELPLFTTSYIKVGIFFHIICGGIMLTNSDIIPTDTKKIPEGKEEELGPLKFAIYKRFIYNSVHGNLYISFFGMLLIFLLFKNTIGKLIARLVKGTYETVFATKIEEPKKCNCVYKEFPIIDLQEIYFKATGELERF
jgi:hypothetical protein